MSVISSISTQSMKGPAALEAMFGESMMLSFMSQSSQMSKAIKKENDKMLAERKEDDARDEGRF